MKGNKYIDFPLGVFGFEDAREFGLIYEGGDIACLQSTDSAGASLLITPWNTSVVGELPCLSSSSKEALGNGSLEFFLVLNPFADEDWVFANTLAPIIINNDAGTGVQEILQNGILRYRWMRQPK